MEHRIKIAPSLLAADFANLAAEVARVEKAGCDLLHIDVMDGHFVPNITVGPFIVQAIRRVTKLPLDAHLMIEHPERYAKSFAEAGADNITVHAEACPGNLTEVLELLRGLSVTRGVSLRPQTPLSAIKAHLVDIDLVLLMTVNPGFGGQAFMPEVMPKVRELRSLYKGDIQVDGGINRETSRQAVEAGANVLVAGTAIFGRQDTREAIEDLRCHR
jgi:ribulose-phosphate 3-epimerase